MAIYPRVRVRCTECGMEGTPFDDEVSAWTSYHYEQKHQPDVEVLGPAYEARDYCCPDKVYFCPTSDDVECPEHGGFDVCCDRIDLHQPLQ